MKPREHPSWGKIIRATRLRAKGRTQRETADALSVSRRSVIRWEARPELWRAAQAEAGVTRPEGDGYSGDRVTCGDDLLEDAGTARVISMRRKGTGQDAASASPSVPMRIQPHGGALQSGNPGNAGSTPSELRARLRGSMRDRINVLEEIADDPESKPSDRIRAIDLLAKYGLGALKELSIEHVRGKLVETIGIVRDELDEADADRVLTRMREVWR